MKKIKNKKTSEIIKQHHNNLQLKSTVFPQHLLDTNNTYKKDMEKSDDFIGIYFKEDFKPNYYLSARDRADIMMADYALNVWDRIVKLFPDTLKKILSKKDTSICTNDPCFCMKEIRTCAPDGEYDLYSSLEVWSKSKIKVKNGMVDKDICATAIAEILEETNYHGRCVESVEFDKDLSDGSFYAFLGSYENLNKN
tara:strand:+ start:1577 stop:2164 length:588 start_codon:yes stop_codon:yes gene_type:complete